jgi:Rps23 Pro-64 3,4-dihydroxylase Tpa1-like proline 4-hydroxylase
MQLDDVERLYERSFLPVDQLGRIAESKAASYREAVPFPHVVLDNFFDEEVLDRVLAEFPREDEIAWKKFNDRRQVKLASTNEKQIPPFTRHFLYELNSSTFLRFLEKLTGVDGLIPDPHFQGGGLHQIVPGGKLGIHTDFNKHPEFHLDRRLNVIVYLNRNWHEEYGGHFELWDREVTECIKRILPIFNRLLIFNTNDFTFHGHPEPLACPPGMTRKSLALYYFSNGRPAHEVSHAAGADFIGRPNEGVTPKEFIKNFVPPIVWKARVKLKRRRRVKRDWGKRTS